MKTTTVIRRTITGKPATKAKQFEDVRSWRRHHGHCDRSRSIGVVKFAGESLKRMRGATVRDLVFGQYWDEDADITPTDGLVRIPFVDHGDVAIAFVNGTAVVESTRRWGRRR